MLLMTKSNGTRAYTVRMLNAQCFGTTNFLRANAQDSNV